MCSSKFVDTYDRVCENKKQSTPAQSILKNKDEKLKNWKRFKKETLMLRLKFEAANISRKDAQYSYEADATFYFMDLEHMKHMNWLMIKLEILNIILLKVQKFH